MNFSSAAAAATGLGGIPAASHQPQMQPADQGFSSPLERRCHLRKRVLCEAIWLENGKDLRSKTFVLDSAPAAIDNLPMWTVEGAGGSTLYLQPRTLHPDPFRASGEHILVLCDTLAPPAVRDDGVVGQPTPHTSNNRAPAAAALAAAEGTHQCVFSVDQQYVLMDPATQLPLGWPSHTDSKVPVGQQFPAAHHQPPIHPGASKGGLGNTQVAGRQFSDAHLRACIHAGLDITGAQAEAVPGQWSYTIGPCCGIDVADQLWMSRFILHRLSEHFQLIVSLDPKPVEGAWAGSGAAVTFSTCDTRERGKGWYAVQAHVRALAAAHMQHIMVYGAGNDRRLTGRDSTSSLMQFTWGMDSRDASVSVPHSVMLERAGGYIDRRPAANMDPYLVTMMLVCTTCCLPLPVFNQGRSTTEASTSEAPSSDILEEMDLLDAFTPVTPPQEATSLAEEVSSDNFGPAASKAASVGENANIILTPQVHGGRHLRIFPSGRKVSRAHSAA